MSSLALILDEPDRLLLPAHEQAELDAFNQMLAVSETAAHLDVLCAQGRIRARAERGIWSYSIGA